MDILQALVNLRDDLKTWVANNLRKKVDKVDGKGLSTNDYTTTEKNKLAGIATGAEVNQNAFSNVKVGSTTIAADTKTDTLTLVAGTNITLTPDATNDKVTIAATDTVYTHPTTAGNKHIPSGGSSGQILRWSAAGTAVWGVDNDTVTTVTETGDGNAITSISATNGAVTATKGSTFALYDDVSSAFNALKETYLPANYITKVKTRVTITLAVASWSSNTQTVTCSGVTTDNLVIVSPTSASLTDYKNAGVTCTTQAANSLTFTCENIPTADLTVDIDIID